VIAEMRYNLSVHPRNTKMRHVMNKVVMTIPETGFEVDPTTPTIKEVTATKRNPKITNKRTVTRFIERVGINHMHRMITTEPMISHPIGISFEVLGRWSWLLNPINSSSTLARAVL